MCNRAVSIPLWMKLMEKEIEELTANANDLRRRMDELTEDDAA